LPDHGDRAGTSLFRGVSWLKTRNKWRARYKGNHLGYHTTEEGAARAYSNYLKDGSVPGPAGPTSQFMGVYWDKTKLKWRGTCNGADLGCHATDEDAARAYSKYLEDGIDPVKHREACTSLFKGVSWHKKNNKWRAACQGRTLSYHTTEDSAAQAYNVEAERVGRPFNVIPLAGAAGAGTGAGVRAGGGAACGSRGRWHGRRCACGRRRRAQARSTEDTGDSRDEQEDEAHCPDDTGCTRVRQEDEAIGCRSGRGGRKQRHGAAGSEIGCSGRVVQN